ncbi:MAG: biotin--[acetyl-CoA-carboxylase] ligase [Candidatus Eisenbacteria bacterium]
MMTRQSVFFDAAGLLRKSRLGKRLVCLYSVTSTNDVAWGEAEAGVSEGTVVVAEEQTEGRGRLGRTWYSPPGVGVWMSVIMRPQISSEAAPGITHCASLAAARAIKVVCPVEVSLKWPNDVLVEGRKVCGILTEMKTVGKRIDFVVCGIGINVNQKPEDFAPAIRAAGVSLRMATGETVERVRLFAEVIKQLDGLYEGFCRCGFSHCAAEWKAMCGSLGKRIRIRTGRSEGDVEGVFSDVDERGALVLRMDSGLERSFLAGDVELVSQESEAP